MMKPKLIGANMTELQLNDGTVRNLKTKRVYL